VETRPEPGAAAPDRGTHEHDAASERSRQVKDWTIPGAQAMLKLRCVAINEQWDEFTPFRIQRETERLYSERKAHETVEWPWPQAA